MAMAQRKEDLQRAMQPRFPKVKVPMVEGMRPHSQPPWMLKSYGLGNLQKNQAFLVVSALHYNIYYFPFLVAGILTRNGGWLGHGMCRVNYG